MALIDIVVANPVTMRQEIVMAYNTPREEFDQLIKAYPLGKYTRKHPKTHWFTIKLDICGREHEVVGELSLIWYVEWRV